MTQTSGVTYAKNEFEWMLEMLGNVLLLLPCECFDRNANVEDVSSYKHVRLRAWGKKRRKKKVYPWYTRFLERYKCMQWLKQIKTRAQDHFQVFHKVKNTNTFHYDVYNENGKCEMGQTNGIKINQDGKMVTWSYLSGIFIRIQL